MRLLARANALRIPLLDGTVDCCVTSPPYWGLRDYGTAKWEGGDESCKHLVRENGAVHAGKSGLDGGTDSQGHQREGFKKICGRCGARRIDAQLGLESTPEEYVARMVDVFREVRRVLRKDGTLWMNLGDSYTSGMRDQYATDRKYGQARASDSRPPTPTGLKPKDLVGIPWRVAFALQADGWYLRSDVIWCLSGGTRVYARTPNAEGPATIHDLVRLDPSTVELWNGERWTQVLGWSSRRSETVRLTLRSGERIIASPNHRWPLEDGRVVETGELAVGDIIATTVLPEPANPTDADIPLDLAWFAGLYLAEGSRSGDAIQIAGNAKEVARHERVMDIARRHGGSAVLHAGSGDGVNLVVHGAFLDAAIRHFMGGRTALDKHIHPRAWKSSNAALRALMEGYLAGDGHFDAPNDRWRLGFGNNPQLVDSLRTLSARLGATLTLSPSLARMGRTAIFEANRGEWRWQASGHRNAKPSAEVMKIAPIDEREVWDIGVADDPHTFALASGVLTHNSKPNPMPESVTDRPTKAHEYLFLLAKSEQYYYDLEAIRENPKPANEGWIRAPKMGAERIKGAGEAGTTCKKYDVIKGANRRSVWTIPTQPYSGAHFATFPEALVRPCVRAGSRFGSVVLDPFAGSGTTCRVAIDEGRKAIGLDLSPEYLKLASVRTTITPAMF